MKDRNGNVLVVGSRVRFSAEQGLIEGTVRAFLTDPDDVWFGNVLVDNGKPENKNPNTNGWSVSQRSRPEELELIS
jgi:hypothetical protein